MPRVRFWIMTAVIVLVAIAALVATLDRTLPLLAAGESATMHKPASGWTSETILRKQAIATEIPEYPARAIHAHRSGVAVAMVYLNLAGHVSQVEILRSPGPAISESMRSSLSRWRFKPFRMPNGDPMLISGKITFYFELQKNRGVVLDPAEVGYVGQWPLVLRTEGVARGHVPDARQSTHMLQDRSAKSPRSRER
jgi:TonB family protein